MPGYTPAGAPASVRAYRKALAALGWAPERDAAHVDTTQHVIEGTRDNSTGILLKVDGVPRLFLRVQQEPVTDPQVLYDTLLLGWNLDAWYTAIHVRARQLRFYETTSKPDKTAVLLGAADPVMECGLDQLLDVDAAHRLTGHLLLLSPDTWHSRDYEQFRTSQTAQQRTSVDSSLVKDLRDWRLGLVKDLHQTYPECQTGTLDSIAQQLLDQIIFIRFCEDRRLTDLKPLFDLAASVRTPFYDKFLEVLREYEELFDTSLFDSSVLERYKPADTLLRTIIAESVELYRFDLLSVDLLGRIYEDCLSYELRQEETQGLFRYELKLQQRKEQGIYYTPAYIVDYLIARARHTFEATNGRPVQTSLDPACGSGVFLTALLKELIREGHVATYQEKRTAIESNFYGIDKDERAVGRAAQAIYYTLLTGETSLTGRDLLPQLIGRNLLAKDSVMDRRQLVQGKKFDIIVSNPPYRRITGDSLVKYRTIYPDIVANQPDLCWLLLVAAIENLVEGGVVAFIVPDNVLRTRENAKVRKYILDTTRIVEISYLNYQAFDSASLQNILLILQRESSEDTRRANMTKVKYFTTPGTFEVETTDEIPQLGFYQAGSQHVFNVQLTAPAKAVYEKIKAGSWQIRDLFHVAQGIKPDPKWLRSTPLSEHSKRYIYGRNISPYCVNWSGSYIDYPASNDRRVNVRRRNPELFECSRKLVVRKISGKRIIAALDTEQLYVDSSAYVLTSKAGVSEDVIFLTLAALNSTIAKFCCLVEYPERKTLFPQFRKMDIARIPVPNPQGQEQKKLVEQVAEETKMLRSKIISGALPISFLYQSPEVRHIDECLGNLLGLSSSDQSIMNAYLER